MIILDTTSKSLEVVLGGNVTTNQLPFSVSYVDTAATPPLSESDGQTNNTTAVTMVSAPGSSTARRIIKTLSIQNKDTASATVTVRLNNSSTLRNIVVVTLAAGSTLMLTDADGWKVMDTNGNILVPTGGSSNPSESAWNFYGNFSNSTATVGFNAIAGVNQQSGAGYTIQTTDFAHLVAVTNSSAQTVKLPSTAPAVGWWVYIQNIGTGTWTVNPNGNNLDGAASNTTLTANQGLMVFSDGSNYFTMRGVGGAAPNVTFLTPASGTSSGTTVSTSAADVATWSISGLTSQDELIITGTIEATTQQTTGYTIRSGTTVIWRPDNQAVIPAGQIIGFRVVIRQSQQSATIVIAEGDISLMNGAGVYADTYGAAQSIVGVWAGPASWQSSWTLSLHFLGQTTGGTSGWSIKVLKSAGQ